jgi:phosphoribosylglycinamide formyltransferase-1
VRIAIFCYDFPHKKSQDFLVSLLLGRPRFLPEFITATDFVPLKLPESCLRVKPRHMAALHPRTIVEHWPINYIVQDSNARSLIDDIQRHRIDIGIIAGARILRKPVIDAVRVGIINFHPALIPEVRGLDSLKWAVYGGHTLGVTAHFIDERVDAGRIILRREIPVYKDDTWIDLSLRLEETQVEMLPEVLGVVEGKRLEDFPLVGEVGKADRTMPVELERELPERLERYLRERGK